MSEQHELMKRLVDAMLGEDGHSCQYMERDLAGNPAPYAYTVGRALRDRPELAVSGPFTPEDARDILDAGSEHDDERPLSKGSELTLEGRGFLVADCPGTLLHAATAIFGRDKFTALQLLWADQKGRFPGHPLYDMPDHVQTIFRSDS